MLILPFLSYQLYLFFFFLRLNPAHHKVLLQATIDGDWESALVSFNERPNSLYERITTHSWTTLHVAATHRQLEFFIQLASKIKDRDRLKERDKFGRISLHYVAKVGTKRAAQALVDRDKEMVLVVNINSETTLV